MKHQISHSVQWSQRLRGYINLKTALALCAIASVSAFVVQLSAQETTKSDCCGTTPQIGNGDFVFAPSSDSTRKNIAVEGQIQGAFRDPGNNNRLTTSRINFSDKNGAGQALIMLSAEKESIYEVSAHISSPKANISAVVIGRNKSNGSGLSVVLGTPTSGAYIYGALPGTELDKVSLPWDISCEPVDLKIPEGSLKISNKDNFAFRGSKTGEFMNLTTGKSQITTLDVNNDDGFGSLAVDFQGDYLLESKKPFTVFALVTKDDNEVTAASMLKEKLLVCMLDAPQTKVRLSGMIEGRKVVTTAIGWVAVEAEEKRISSLSDGYFKPSHQGDMKLLALPKLTSPRVEVRSNAQVSPPAPTATPAPTTAPAPTGHAYSYNSKPRSHRSTTRTFKNTCKGVFVGKLA